MPNINEKFAGNTITKDYVDPTQSLDGQGRKFYDLSESKIERLGVSGRLQQFSDDKTGASQTPTTPQPLG